jgi:NAD-dependent histone deacetylase SIR2
LGEVDASQKPQLDRLLKVLHKKRKIVVIAGAGISVSAGSK